jgi:hypothetical protein
LHSGLRNLVPMAITNPFYCAGLKWIIYALNRSIAFATIWVRRHCVVFRQMDFQHPVVSLSFNLFLARISYLSCFSMSIFEFWAELRRERLDAMPRCCWHYKAWLVSMVIHLNVSVCMWTCQYFNPDHWSVRSISYHFILDTSILWSSMGFFENLVVRVN